MTYFSTTAVPLYALSPKSRELTPFTFLHRSDDKRLAYAPICGRIESYQKGQTCKLSQHILSTFMSIGYSAATINFAALQDANNWRPPSPRELSYLCIVIKIRYLRVEMKIRYSRVETTNPQFMGPHNLYTANTRRNYSNTDAFYRPSRRHISTKLVSLLLMRDHYFAIYVSKYLYSATLWQNFSIGRCSRPTVARQVDGLINSANMRRASIGTATHYNSILPGNIADDLDSSICETLMEHLTWHNMRWAYPGTIVDDSDPTFQGR